MALSSKTSVCRAAESLDSPSALEALGVLSGLET